MVNVPDNDNLSNDLIAEIVTSVIVAVAEVQNAASLDFYHETCASCLYYRETPTGGFRGNICRYYVNTATSINQVGYPLHMMANEPACGQWKRNPFRAAADAKRLIAECVHGAT